MFRAGSPVIYRKESHEERNRGGSSVFAGLLYVVHAPAQEKKLEKIRVGGGSASATQMSLWLAKEGNFYEKNGLSVEAISIPGSSLALQAMLAGDLPIIQLGGAASIQANFSGADTVIVATIVRKFLFWIFARPGFERMEDLRGKVFGTTRFGTLSDLAARFALRSQGIDLEEISRWSRPVAQRKQLPRWSQEKLMRPL